LAASFISRSTRLQRPHDRAKAPRLNGGKLIAPRRGMTQVDFGKTMYGITDDDLKGVTTISGQPVTADYLRNRATLESVGGGLYRVKLGTNELNPIYAMSYANTDTPRKFEFDLRNKPMSNLWREPFSTANAQP
jgi:hypothetical protein